MKYCFMVFIFICTIITLFAQKHDAIWVIGESPHIINFNSTPPNITFFYDHSINFYHSNATISDKNGFLAFYSNGGSIFNKKHKLMKNGKINGEPSGYTIVQGTITLPFPQHDSLYLVLHQGSGFISKVEPILFGAKTFYYSIVDMAKNNGEGEVISLQNPVLLTGKYANYGKLVAVKKENGIDWWVIFMEINSNVFYRYELTKDTFAFVGTQEFSWKITDGDGAAAFSPDGTKLAMYNNLGASYGQHLDIYDFDRCTGLVSNHKFIDFKDAFGAGVAFSLNSKLLYHSIGTKVIQYNLAEKDFFKTAITIYQNDTIGTYTMQLAMDNKIYICPYVSAFWLAIINNPDIVGNGCNATLLNKKMPYGIYKSIPYFPNFRQSAIKCFVDTSEVPDYFKHLSVYPNPALSETKFNFNTVTQNDIQLKIYNITGHLVFSTAIPFQSTEYKMNVENLSNGVYFYELRDEIGKVITGKLMKM